MTGRREPRNYTWRPVNSGHTPSQVPEGSNRGILTIQPSRRSGMDIPPRALLPSAAFHQHISAQNRDYPCVQIFERPLLIGGTPRQLKTARIGVTYSKSRSRPVAAPSKGR